MINLISKNIVHFFVIQNTIKQEEEDIYRYGIELLVSTSTSLIASFLIALFFGKWYDFFVYYLLFVPIRMNAGGYHADTYGKCFLTTT